MNESVPRRAMRLLLVEDNPDDAALLRETLQRHNGDRFQLREARTRAQALAALGRGDFDLVVLDLSLPDSFGSETFVEIKRHALELPVVVLTAVDDEELGARLVRMSAQEYLVKGELPGDSLAHCLTHACERHRAERELRESRWRARRAMCGSMDAGPRTPPGTARDPAAAQGTLR